VLTVSAFDDPDRELGPDEARRAIDRDDALVIDVRQEYEREAGRIPASRHIDMDRLASEADDIPQERPLIFYCRKGLRSGLAAHGFRSAGWDAYNLKGGLLAWVDAGQPIDPPEGHVAQH
jgi:rhodanese-related sulfurtransferase